MVINILFSYQARNFFNNLATISFSTRALLHGIYLPTSTELSLPSLPACFYLVFLLVRHFDLLFAVVHMKPRPLGADLWDCPCLLCESVTTAQACHVRLAPYA
jgi:hypothetical protein